MYARNGEQHSSDYGLPPVAKYASEEMKDEDRADEMQHEVECILQPEVARGEMLEDVESNVYQRPEEVDDAKGEYVRRRHVVACPAHPREIVVEEVIVGNAVVRDETQDEQEQVNGRGQPPGSLAQTVVWSFAGEVYGDLWVHRRVCRSLVRQVMISVDNTIIESRRAVQRFT